MKTNLRNAARGNRQRDSYFRRFLNHRLLNSYAVLVGLSCAFGIVAFGLCTQRTVDAANPSSASLSPTSTSVSWQGTALGGAAVGDPLLGLVGAEELCIEGQTCDTFTLTVNGTRADWAAGRKLIHIHLGWTLPTNDYDLYVHRGDVNGPVVASSGNGATNQILTSEDADLDPSSPSIGTGTFAIRVVYYYGTAAEQYQATASVVDAPAPPPDPGPTPTPQPEPPGTPRFYSYLAPPGVADDAGEPSIGVNWRTERVFNGIPNGGTVNYFGGFLPYMLRATFNDGFTPAKVTWEKAPLVVAAAPRVFGDPILFTDPQTGRTFVSQELGLTPAGSTMEWTDDDGRTFTPSMGSGAPSGIDHQTVGGGPFAQPIPTGVNPLYPNGVWYCSQSIVDAVCSISLDGGVTFGPAVPMYSLLDCGGLHGHVKIGPDGTAYVPNRQCGENQAVVVSEDNGVTWTVRKLPESSAADRDPSVAVASDNTLYFSYQNADGHSRVAVSRDKGLTWERDTDVGAQLGIKNSLFHAAVAGDGDRAAVAFFGTTQSGSDYNLPTFTGVWYLYVSTTFDRGMTWWTQNVTPNDPIQRGGICEDGACRNLLDFFGAEIDKQGRVLVGYDDGCISRGCVTGERSYGLPGANDFIAKGAISRQISGKRMFAAYDPPPGPTVEPPAAPLPPAAGLSCNGNVAVDSTGDATLPLVGFLGNPNQFDLTGVSFALSQDGQSISTNIKINDFTTTPPLGSLGGYYRAIWTSGTRNTDGSITTKTYATQVTTSLTGVTYRYGLYDPEAEGFIGSTTTATGSYTTGPNGTLTVNVPLSFLGNPTIPVLNATQLPAVIEPYALVFSHEEVVSFVTPVDRAPDYGFAGSNWAVCPTTSTVIDDDYEAIAYSSGWHTVGSTAASGGHFRFHSGRSPSHSMVLTFNVGQGQTGKLTYFYATSTKGGTADVLLDGVATNVNYRGSTGGLKDPTFGSSLVFANLPAGPHTLEIRNMNEAVYVDGFRLESSTPMGQPTSGPGQTTTNLLNLNLGQQLTRTLPVTSNATSVSVVSESVGIVPVRLLLINPSGLVLQSADSVNGVAVLDVPVNQGGTYVVKVINLNLGPVQVWTAATPTVRR